MGGGTGSVLNSEQPIASQRDRGVDVEAAYKTFPWHFHYLCESQTSPKKIKKGKMKNKQETKNSPQDDVLNDSKTPFQSVRLIPNYRLPCKVEKQHYN